MQNKQFLPIPFLILILAGVVSLFSIVADRGARATVVRNDSLQMQTVEQERMAEFYFRILSWLSDVIPRAAERVKARPQPAPIPQSIRTPRRRARPGRLELCTLRTGQTYAVSKLRTRHLN
jgi:hypothetical protein